MLGKWQRLAAGHVVLGSGCSCGTQLTSVRMQDFEQDILGFLQGRHRASEHTTSIQGLLSTIARRKTGAGADQDLALLADLERSIDSFEELHRGAGR